MIWKLRTTTVGNNTYYSTYVWLLREIIFKLDARVDRIFDRSWERAHGRPPQSADAKKPW